LEDPFEGNDWTSFLSEETTKAASAESRLTAMLIVGDDLPASNVDRFPEAAQRQACNALLLKPNQCGTVTDSINAAVTAEKYRWTVMTARRTGETEDDFTADFSVGISAKYIKAGAPCRSERLAKYNQILVVVLVSPSPETLSLTTLLATKRIVDKICTQIATCNPWQYPCF
jgi:enolase